jgi:hypothetical protein
MLLSIHRSMDHSRVSTGSSTKTRRPLSQVGSSILTSSSILSSPSSASLSSIEGEYSDSAGDTDALDSSRSSDSYSPLMSPIHHHGGERKVEKEREDRKGSRERAPILFYQPYFIGNTKARAMLKQIYDSSEVTSADFNDLGLKKINKAKKGEGELSRFEYELQGRVLELLQAIRNDQLEETLILLNRERIAEMEREALLVTESNPAAVSRMTAQFERDRQAARERIGRVRFDNEMGLAALIAKHGIIR